MDRKVLLEVKNLSFHYPRGEEVLTEIDLSIYEGERLVILGPNGAGKSTLFLLLNGILEPVVGELFLKGERIHRKKKDLNLLRKSVGIVFQNADNQIIAPTVEDEISFGPINMGLSKEAVRERVDLVMKQMGIEAFYGRAPHYLSGGEKKRVTVADIIAMDPDILIFDEPTAALDPLGAERLEETLKYISDKGKTIIISTHLVDFAWRWADRIVVISNGKILADGDPIEVFMDQNVLEIAHLKKPALIGTVQTLIRNKILPEETCYPRDQKEFEKLFK